MYRIKNIESVNVKHVQYSDLLKQHSNNNLYEVNEDGELIAYVSCYMKDNEVLWLSMIEVIEKGKGVGKRVVDFLFSHFNCKEIEGFILCEERALKFWEKIGANIYYVDYEGYEVEELVDAELESPFTYKQQA